MAKALEDLLRTCTVRVTGGPHPGAGFFVAPGKVLTCVHVIGDGHGLTVRWERDGADPLEAPVSGLTAVLDAGGRPIPALARDYPDIAVLEVDGLDGHPCVSIDVEWPSQDDTFQVFGYPREGGSELLTSAKLTYRGPKGTAPTIFLDLASDRVRGGMSGAAVLNLRTGGVCGIIVASKDTASPNGALAIPWSAVDADLVEVLAANQAFHRTDQQWNAATAARRDLLRFRLPRVVSHFAGRDDLLTRLDAALRQDNAGVITQSISGLGGVGKTQLAAAYVTEHHVEYDIAAWIRAEDGGIADLASLAVALGLPVTDRTPPERADDALAYLAGTRRRWLLVLDNVPGPRALTKLPVSGQGRVLVTSRHRGGYGDFGPELPVGVFDPGTARDYLLSRTGRSSAESSDADAVAFALGCLPLALAHAGAYCASGTGVPFREYLALLENLPSQDLFDSSPEIFYQDTVAATWRTSINSAKILAPLARPALEMAAFLAPDAIPRSFFSVLADNSAAARKLVIDALTALNRYSLFTLDNPQVGVHRLLQKVIRDQLPDSAQSAAVRHALAAVERGLPADPELPATWPQWQELLPHILALADIDAVAALDATRLVKILNQACDFLFYAGFTRETADLAAQTVTTAETRLRPDDPDILTARENLAACYWSAGRIADAVTIQEQVAGQREHVLGPDHPDTLNALNNLANSYRSAGRFADAIATLEKVAAERERVLGPDHRDTLTACANLAASYQSAGRTADAIALKEQVAAERERVLGPDHPDTLTARANLAVSYWSADRTTEAITVLESATIECERVLGRDHPTTVRNRGRLTEWKAHRDGNRAD